MAQDGFIQRKVDGHMIRYRGSILPIVGREFQYKFESIVIRVLDDRKVITNLDMALGASFVCRVENVKWPVFASLIAISAVSLSLISPTITTSGS